ncbi:MAG TPA: hypothetical protein DDW52_13490 [Planctomycetaceae bacterium]|nr:hypothetical protein [Planctomycetaceae bacterium]
MRPRYTITPDDYPHARDYLDRFDLDAEGGSRKAKAKRLNDWCEENLDSDEWSRLKSAIRKRRHRLAQGDTVVTVTISREVRDSLSREARQNGVTMDQLLRKVLKMR